jgi:hypothetical protein
VARRALLIAGVLLLAGCFDELGDYEDGASSTGGTVPDDADEGGGVETTSSGSGATSATGGPTGAEICDNGGDDDADGLVDCQDGDCGGYVCVPAPADPAFAGGPHLLVDASADVPCNPAFPATGIDGVRVVDAPSPCDCTCGAATGQACAGTAQLHAAAGCSGAATSAAVAATCSDSSASVSSVVVSASPSGGACTGSPVAPVPPTFEPAHTCSAGRGGGCEPGFVCARPPAPDGTPRLCFERSGNHACDDPTYTTKLLVFEDTPVDNRSCSGNCGCEAPSGGACMGTLTVNDGSCGGPPVATAQLGACTTFGAGISGAGLALGATVSTPGGCTPIPRTESGALEGVAHTLCCAEGL